MSSLKKFKKSLKKMSEREIKAYYEERLMEIEGKKRQILYEEIELLEVEKRIEKEYQEFYYLGHWQVALDHDEISDCMPEVQDHNLNKD